MSLLFPPSVSRWLIAIGACAALAIISPPDAWAEGTVNVEGTAKTAQPRLLPSITVTQATERAITDRVLATGSIEAVEEIHVSPLVEGLAIRTLTVERGDWVERGQPLAVLNDDALVVEKSQIEAGLLRAKATLAQLQAQLAEARATAEEATRVANRAERLSANKTVSTAEAERLTALAAVADARRRSAEQSLSIAAADIKLAAAQLEYVGLRLSRTAVKAPVSGIVSAKNAKVGAIAGGSGQPLYAIIRDGTVDMKADVAEADLGKLAVGQTALVRLAGNASAVQGKIRLIAPTVDPLTRLGAVYIALADAPQARPGMYASAVLIAEEKRAVTLPRTAVASENGKASVCKVENGVVRQVPVTVGIQDGPLVEILSGIKAGDLVVAKAGVFVSDGDLINPIAPIKPAPPVIN